MGRVWGGGEGGGTVYIVKKYISEGCMTYQQSTLVDPPPKKGEKQQIVQIQRSNADNHRIVKYLKLHRLELKPGPCLSLNLLNQITQIPHLTILTNLQDYCKSNRDILYKAQSRITHRCSLSVSCYWVRIPGPCFFAIQAQMIISFGICLYW